MNFRPQNHARWLESGYGVQFESAGNRSPYDAGGIAYTPEPLSYAPNQLKVERSGSIELWLMAAGEPNYCRFRILSFEDSHGRETLFIGQWKSHLLIRFLIEKPGGKPAFREIGIRYALKKNQKRFLTITSDAKSTDLYLEGKHIRRYVGISLFSDSFSFDHHRLYLGNNPNLTCPWSGIIQGMALYGIKINASEAMAQYRKWLENVSMVTEEKKNIIALYEFDPKNKPWIRNTIGAGNHILIPPKLKFNRPALMVPNANTLYAYDIVINIVGFIPFGFFITLWLVNTRKTMQRAVYLIPLAAGFLVSFSIELLQIYLPARSSSMMDLVCNTLGTGIGVMAAFYIIKLKASLRPRGSL